jgi:hypothetical protein
VSRRIGTSIRLFPGRAFSTGRIRHLLKHAGVASDAVFPWPHFQPVK